MVKIKTDQNLQLKQMPEMQPIIECFRDMSFEKQLLGGCREENVLDKIETITEMFLDVVIAKQMLVEQLSRQLSAAHENNSAPAQTQISEHYKNAYANLYSKSMRLIENFQELQTEHMKIKQTAESYLSRNDRLSEQLKKAEETLQTEQNQHKQQIAALKIELEEQCRTAAIWEKHYKMVMTPQSSANPNSVLDSTSAFLADLERLYGPFGKEMGDVN